MMSKTKTDKLRVMLVDDHAMVRAGHERLLALEADIEVVGGRGDADAAYHALQAGTGAVDVMVLDLSMPGRSGLDLIRRALARWPALKVLVCSMHDSPAMVAQALQAGAAGFVTKASDPGLLADAIRRVAHGELALSPDVAQAYAAPAAKPPNEQLTPGEFEVFVRLVRGDAIDAIAEALKLAPKTVFNRQAAIRAKLGIGTAVELVRYARAHGLDAG